MKANLIASRYECPRCKKEMRFQERKGTVDGYEWRCRSQSKDNSHDVVRSVRKGTWFSESKLAITIILRLTRYWFGKSMNAFVVNADLTVTSWWMTIFMNSLHPSQGCIHQRNMTKCKRKVLSLIFNKFVEYAFDVSQALGPVESSPSPHTQCEDVRYVVEKHENKQHYPAERKPYINGGESRQCYALLYTVCVAVSQGGQPRRSSHMKWSPINNSCLSTNMTDDS
ncbi:uncharacterized protein TNCV_3203401 [Trichonephila clavipes]|nr:uncharacterized protein TNCV_3203401 [Trichonephila clavipes]